MAGDRVGKFACADRLGAGGMGEVWKAHDVELDRWVALKFLKGGDDDEIARFTREAQIAGRLNHPNIAAIYEVGTHDGRHFIAMQLVEGVTLKAVPRDDRRRLVRIVRDAARAIAFAHDQGVVHRDVKPDNIMVTSKDHVYVLDFGLARQVRGAVSVSVSGQMMGTPAYMSPEQARGERADARSDVFALGVTLYELLADRMPFTAEGLVALLTSICSEDPKPLRRVDPSIDPDLETIVRKCLEKERHLRYAGAAALADDLDRWLAGEPIAARPPSVLYLLRKRVLRRKAVLAVAAAGVIATGAVAAGVVPKWLAAERERVRREAELEGERRARAKVELYVPLEGELNLLRMNFYRPDYRLTPGEFEKYDVLVARVREQMRSTGESAQGWYLVGRCREVRAEFAAADGAYARALELQPDHARTLVARGRLAVERALHDRLRDRLNAASARALRRDAEAAAAWIERGAAMSGGEGEMEAALARAYVHVIATWGPQREPPPDAAPLLEKWKGRPGVEEFMLPQAIAMGGRPAVAMLTRFLASVPSNPSGYLWRAAARQTIGEMDEARADCDRAIAINPRFAEAYLLRSVLRHIANDARGAVEDCDRAIELNGPLALAHLRRGSAHVALGDQAAALADFNRVLEIEPDNPQALAKRAATLAARGEWEAAIAGFDRAIQVDGTSAEAFNMRSTCRHMRGDFDGAIDDCTRAIELSPESAESYYNRAAAYYAKQELRKAIGDYGRVLALRPDHARALFNRGKAHSALDEPEAAIADYDRYVALCPTDPQGWMNRGADRLHLRDVAGAIADYEKALQVAPADWPLRGRVEEAIRALRRGS